MHQFHLLKNEIGAQFFLKILSLKNILGTSRKSFNRVGQKLNFKCMKKHLHEICSSMKRGTMLLFMVLLSAIALFAAITTIKVVYLSAEEQAYELKQLGYVELEGDEMTFFDKEGNELHVTKIKEVQKIVIGGEPSTGVENVDGLSMEVYPNPSMNELFIKGMELGDVLRIYTIDGTLVKTQVVESEITRIDVSNLAVGSYLIQSKGNVVKFIKE